MDKEYIYVIIAAIVAYLLLRKRNKIHDKADSNIKKLSSVMKSHLNKQ
jgi:hypothetical protein